MRSNKLLLVVVIGITTTVVVLTIYFVRKPINQRIENPVWVNQINTTTSFTSPPSCPRTAIFPFKVGCPAICNRTDLINDVPLYRTSIAWYFGQTNSSNEGLGFEGGINFQSVPRSFVDEFVTTMNDLENQTEHAIGSIISFKRQDVIHISLSYLCCLTKNEIYITHELLTQWILKNYPFDIPIQFEKLHCFRERFESVTNILEVDDTSQLLLLKLNRDIRQYLQDNGIPVPIRREEQMRFHTTVLGMHYGDDSETTLPENDISLNLTTISKVISSFENLTWSKNIRIQHAPKISAGPVVFQQHAGPKEPT